MAKQDDSTKIIELLEIIKHKVDSLDLRQTGQSATISLMKDQMSVMNKKMNILNDPDTGLQRVNDRLDAHTSSLATIEQKIDIYDDMYQNNRDNIKKLDKRLDLLEEDNGVEVPPELQLIDVS